MTLNVRLSNSSHSLAAALFFGSMWLVASSEIQAGEITSFTWSSGIASLGAVTITPPPSPNNDDVVGASPNFIFIHQKHYVGIGPVDIQFNVINSGIAPSSGVTEYVFVEGVYNDTGIPWTDYHLQLGFGMGAAFMPSAPGDGLDFDFPSPSSPFSFVPFTTVVVGEDDIDAYGGVVPNLTYVFPFVFHIDVPDGITAFTVRQYPTIDDGTVPEPSSLLLASAVLGTLVLRRRTSTVLSTLHN